MEKSEINKRRSVEIDSSDNTDDEHALKIVEELPSTPKRRKKHQKTVDFDGSQQLDKTISDFSEKCNNFTPEVAKKILMKLVKNEHVLAHTILKAEEEEARERRKSYESDDDAAKSEPEQPVTPKMTRLKAKQLNTKMPGPGPLTEVLPDEEVVALIHEELRSDDEDDEYQPCDDDNQSDDDYTNATYSDIDSQPSTPGSALFNPDNASPAKSDDFKVPSRPTLKLSQEESENISKRTRSKLCLTTTPIETIESTFIPPDITLDMYDMHDQEDDNEWKEFLNEFMMPLLNNPEEDDVEDPEYVASEATPLDKEELRPVRVSKKELNQLISELIDESANFMTLDAVPTPSSSRKSLEWTGIKKGNTRISSPINIKSSRVSKTSTEPSLQTPTNPKSPIVETTPVKTMSNESLPVPDPATYLQTENQFETPEKVQTKQSLPMPPTISPASYAHTASPVVSSPSINNQSFPQITGVYGSQLPSIQNQPQNPMILVTNAHNQLELVPASSILNQAFDNNGIVQLPQYQSVVTMVPTIDLLQNRWNLPPIVATAIDGQGEVSEVQIEEIDVDEPTSEVERTKRERNKRYLEEFQDLETRTPTEHVFPAGSVDFTPQQIRIYEQQMRIHCQLLTQNFFQTFSHPKLWTHADQFKENLHQLRDIVKPETSPVNSKHIETCIETCESWKKELDENNEANKRYAEFMYAEVDFDETNFEKRRAFAGRFHPRLMERLLNSKAILYPWLLPFKPFRCVDFKKGAVPNSELSLWAFEIGKFYAEIHEKINRSNRKNPRDPTVNEIAAELLRKLGKVSNEKPLISHLSSLKIDKRMNPIKYVFKHKRYINYQHDFEEIDLKKIVAPVRLRRGLLPKCWDDYMFSHSRLQKFPYHPEYEDEEECVEIISEAATNDINESSIENTPKVLTVDNSFQLEIVYGETPQINISLLQNTTQKEIESELVSCPRLLSPPAAELQQPSEVSLSPFEDKQKNLTSILKKVPHNLDSSQPKQRKSVNFILPSPTEDKFSIPFILHQKFFIIVESFFTNYCKDFKFKRSKANFLPKVFIWTRTIDIYLQFVKISIEMSKKKGVENNEIPIKTKRSVSSEEFTNKLKKRLQETRNSIVQTELNKCSIEKDCSFAYNYLERVKNALMENGDDDLFVEFMTVLRSFDPTKQSVPELYYEIESLFLPNYADLVDIFITFMLPEHAAEVGKFFENNSLNDMQSLIKKLTIVFSKQPNQIKKILSLLNELASERDVTIDVIKEKLFPLLKGNQLLIDWFMQLFDKPPDCPLSEYETINLKKCVSDDSSEDSYEEIPATDLIECDNFDEMKSCGVQYRNGKIYYYCGTLLPAKIAFLAIDAKLPESTASTSDKPRGLCVHEIRKHVTFTDKKVEEPNENAKKTVGKKKIKKKGKEGDDKNEKKVKKKKKSVICDSHTLHAHAVRLNPVHAQHGEKLSDLTHYFTGSPKKHRNKKTGNSPEKASPSSETATTSDTSPIQPVVSIQRIKEEVLDEPVKKRIKLEETTIPRVTTTIISAEKQSSSALSKKPRSEIPVTSTSTPTGKKDKLVQDRSSENWTRDEDKIILEEIKVGYDKKEKVFEVLLSKLKRSRNEIQQRYEFLFDLVMMMN